MRNNLPKVILILSLAVVLAVVVHPLSSAAAFSKEDQTIALVHGDDTALGLNYHRIRDMDFFEQVLKAFSTNKELSAYSVSTEAFEKHILWLKAKGAHFLTLKELLASIDSGKFPPKSVWINFDDMDISVYENAFPILKKYHIPATGFLITDQIGNPNFNNLQMIDTEQLKEMHASGLWDFGSHTGNLHELYYDNKATSLTSATAEEIDSDLKNSNAALQQLFGTDNRTLAYPYGAANDTVTDVMENRKIQYGFTLEDAAIKVEGLNKNYIPRVMISENAFESLIKNWRGFDE